ncbi:MAG: hypothetical protein PHR96_01850 [Clostridia bacterium]|nr:hypothetical protein [Clostridia bacterium]
MEMETKVLDKQVLLKDDGSDVLVIILLFKNPNFPGILKPYELDLCGKRCWEWVELACSGYSIKTITCTPETDVLTLIKPLLTDKRYTMVLYSDTPLLTKNTIEEILSYVRSRDINILNLIRGYVFNTDYIRNVQDIKGNLIEKFNEKDFISAFDLKQFEYIGQVINRRILNYHLTNGVIITDVGSTFINADVIIESGCVLEPNNIIKGKTYIGKSCHLESGNIIIDSFISDNCILKTSYIFNSKIDKNIIVGPFEKVINKAN